MDPTEAVPDSHQNQDLDNQPSQLPSINTIIPVVIPRLTQYLDVECIKTCRLLNYEWNREVTFSMWNNLQLLIRLTLEDDTKDEESLKIFQCLLEKLPPSSKAHVHVDMSGHQHRWADNKTLIQTQAKDYFANDLDYRKISSLKISLEANNRENVSSDASSSLFNAIFTGLKRSGLACSEDPYRLDLLHLDFKVRLSARSAVGSGLARHCFPFPMMKIDHLRIQLTSPTALPVEADSTLCVDSAIDYYLLFFSMSRSVKKVSVPQDFDILTLKQLIEVSESWNWPLSSISFTEVEHPVWNWSRIAIFRGFDEVIPELYTKAWRFSGIRKLELAPVNLNSLQWVFTAASVLPTTETLEEFRFNVRNKGDLEGAEAGDGDGDAQIINLNINLKFLSLKILHIDFPLPVIQCRLSFRVLGRTLDYSHSLPVLQRLSILPERRAPKDELTELNNAFELLLQPFLQSTCETLKLLEIPRLEQISLGSADIEERHQMLKSTFPTASVRFIDIYLH